MKPNRRESPYPRTRANGKKVWVARYTGPDGKRRYWKPAWNRGSAMFKLKADAQTAIDEAYDRVYGIALLVALGGLYALFAYVVIEDFFWRRKQRKFAAKQRPIDLTSPEGRERLGLSQRRGNQ